MKVYGRKTGPADTPEIVKVGIADYAVSADGPTFSTSGLGSCVGVALYDEEAMVSGLAHVMLPDSSTVEDDNDGKFANTAIPAMVVKMEAIGATPRNITAKLAGGSNMLQFSSIGGAIGTRNVEAVKAVLSRHDIAVAAEDVGGKHGRSLRFDSETSMLQIKSATEGVKLI